MRRLWPVLVCAALLPIRPAVAADPARDRGILVRLQPPRFAIRELDGSRVTFRTNRTTVVTLNGRRVRLRRLQLGDVVTVAHVGRLATALRAVRP
jgi:hypothetical protein